MGLRNRGRARNGHGNGAKLIIFLSEAGAGREEVAHRTWGRRSALVCSVAREMAHGEAAFRLNGEASFRDATVQALFLEEQPDQLRHIKLGADACSLKGELLRLFVQEAVSRAGNLAHLEGFDEIRSEHLEKILPQLLLDFA